MEGTETALVPYGHWGLCPVHNADFLAEVTVQQAPKLPKPELLDRGIPAPRPAA
jgi:hypothetical protein